MEAKQLFEILIRENATMLLAFLRSAVRDANTADDLFQETMLVAWRRLEDYDRSRPFGAWLRGIAGKLLFASFRAQKGQPKNLDQSDLEWLDGRYAKLQDQPGDTFSEKLSALRDCVGSLPQSYRDPIRMKYQDGMPLGIIGQSLSITLETLKKRLTRAKRTLADCLDRKITTAEQSP